MKIRILNEKVNKARIKYNSAIELLITELEKISGLTLYYNNFPGDGLGIGINGDSYMPIKDVLNIIEKNGIITEEDFFPSL